MNTALLTILVESTQPTDGCVKAKILSYGSKGETFPLNAIAFARTGDRLAATPPGAPIVVRAQLQPGDKFKPMLIKIVAVLGAAGDSIPTQSQQPIASAPATAPPSPPPQPRPVATADELLADIPF